MLLTVKPNPLNILLVMVLVLFSGSVFAQNKPIWHQLKVDGPEARYNHLMAYDSNRKMIVLYGGVKDINKKDTWQWDGSRWEKLDIKDAGHHQIGGMVYDEARKTIMMFGGDVGTSSYGNTTWLFDGAKWNQVFPKNSPSPRYGFSMDYDTKRKRVVLYGGLVPNSDGASKSDIWEWDGDNWMLMAEFTSISKKDKSFGPRKRGVHSAAYDSRRGVLVIHGGIFATTLQYSGALSDTWEWNGTTIRLRTTKGFGERYEEQMVYDPVRKRSVIFGGYKYNILFDQTWEWNGKNWKMLSTKTTPDKRRFHAMVYDKGRSEVFMFGGSRHVISGDKPLADTWVLRFETDLYPTNVVARPQILSPGKTVVLKTVIRNKRKGWSYDGGTIHFYLSKNKKWSKNDIQIGSFNIDAIPGNGKLKFKQSIIMPSINAGTYYIIAVVNDHQLGDGTDSNMRNNRAASIKTVTVQ